MRRLLSRVAVMAAVLSSAGCFVNAYSSNPNERVVELLNQSEDLRQIKEERKRIFFVDQPSHLSFERVHGGVAP